MGPQGSGGEPEDPMMRMLQQMMGGAGTGGPGEGGGLPPELAAMLGGGGMQQQQEASTSTYIWKIVHAIFALTLGVYVISSSTFRGTESSRLAVGIEKDGKIGDVRNFFWLFATAELLLQSTRFFLERGKTSQGGMLAMASNFLPEPYKGYLALISRYSGIYTTIVQDAMVVVFVLGAVAWWGGEVG